MTTAADRTPVFSALSRIFNQRAKQLWFEKNQSFLRGKEEDIAAVVKLDKKIGTLLKRYNGTARIPDDKLKPIENDIDKLSPVFHRLSGWKPRKEGFFEGIFSKNSVKNTEIAVNYLEFNNYFISPTGGEIEQRIARIRLGGA